MAVTTMQHTKLIKRLRADFSGYTFSKGDDFYWSSSTLTIFYPQLAHLQDVWSLLHEIAHAELGHTTYQLDIELVQHEVQAWHYAATTLAPRYGVTIDQNYAQDHLDTYREWLHSRSSCPECGQTGLQTKNTYNCINCRCSWWANEARLCALRRIKLPSQSQTFE